MTLGTFIIRTMMHEQTYSEAMDLMQNEDLLRLSIQVLHDNVLLD
jgi:hypothetical protein